MYAMRIVLAAAAGGAVVALAGFPAANAGQAPAVPAHQHFIVQPDGSTTEVGPRVCENPNLQTAFNEFHKHIHVGSANTAFDHEHNPVDVTFVRPCP